MESVAHGASAVGALLERMHDHPPRELHLQHRPLRGGLESAGVARVVARWLDRAGRRRVFTLVTKRLEGAAAREALVYEHLLTSHEHELAPRLLTADRRPGGPTMLYLESLRPSSTWPWRDVQAATAVLEQAALVHETALGSGAAGALGDWDYEAELRRSAEVTVERLEQVRLHREYAALGRGLRWARRLASALPSLRRQLLAFRPFGSAAIHGDLHPGNVVLRRRGGRDQAVLLDWGRARLGSPLEDVSSWLQSLAGWEPVARRRHDTLFSAYLAARGMDRRLGTDLRAAYWLAGASNALSGALAYHLSVVLDEEVTELRRGQAASAAGEWLRVLRRADASWS